MSDESILGGYMGRREQRKERAAKEEGEQEKQKVSYYLPQESLNQIDEIRVALRRAKNLSPRQSSHSAIVARALEHYHKSFFPEHSEEQEQRGQ